MRKKFDDKLEYDEGDDKDKDKDGDLMVGGVEITGSNNPTNFAESGVGSSAEETLVFGPHSVRFLGKIGCDIITPCP